MVTDLINLAYVMEPPLKKKKNDLEEKVQGWCTRGNVRIVVLEEREWKLYALSHMPCPVHLTVPKSYLFYNKLVI